jgi:choline transport protein
MIGIGVLGTLMNTYGAKHLPVLEGIVLIVHIFGFFCIIIPLWVLAPKAPASEVFGTFENFGGWSSIGAACFVGSITATGSFAGSDAAVHMSEETKDASKSVPRMIVFTIVLNGLMGLVFIITYVSHYRLLGVVDCETRRVLTGPSAVLLHHEYRGCGWFGKSLSIHGCKCYHAC